MFGIKTDEKTLKGKNKIKFIAADTESKGQVHINGKWYYRTKEGFIPELGVKLQKMPCGQCIQCKLKKSKEIAIRAMHELETRESAIGITLTYNDENLPYKLWYNEDGELERKVPTLFERDANLFNKKLEEIYRRGYYRYKDSKEKILLNKKDITKFYAGEYGDETERPHYHQVWYNLEIPDMEFLGLSKKGNPLYMSKMLNEIWGKGFVTLNEIEYEYVAYVARYTTKKQTGKGREEYYNIKGYEEEFARFPKKPALGKEWYERNKEKIYKNDEIFIATQKGGIKLKPPKYYDNKFEIEFPEIMELIKKQREETAQNNEELKNRMHNYGKQQLREIQERSHMQRIEILKRDSI